MARKKNGQLNLKTEAFVAIPVKLYNQAQKKLDTREMDINEYVCLQLRMFLRSRSSISLQDTMPFGKYVGENVETVCRADLPYMNWILTTAESRTKFDPDVQSLVDQLLGAEERI